MSETTMVRPKGVNGHKLLKQELALFWAEFKGTYRNEQTKLRALVAMAAVVIPYHRQKKLPDRRDEFNERKTKLHPWRRFGYCFVCQKPATARHHIIQLQNGGINSRKNIVSVCDPCHAQIHPWLARAAQGKADQPSTAQGAARA